ncbi:MAG TPA: histidine--tRNA ligase [Candidatus Omnitrophica bacterium]|nr:MAG: histidine--tRNA ligase [Candidatus Omnitrophota bacterium]RKY34512.1 MAG: histidine--tRNA ligase [Candidatus Omnitrophota bacterium]RKY44861.1 MAG: histidine--tRNA ligase [Candidatus Omnitrophota bacterium]HEC69691.1 histidine--tRNA ligase [Candidatus Omnitrophota bacterium]
MSGRYRPPRGTKDFLSGEAYTSVFLENKAREIFYLYGYREVRLPLIESKDIFIRSLGENTEVVEKQIFEISSRENLCLRPEATAQIVRAYIGHSLYLQRLVKLFYIGPMFRGERPQKGRFRQFHHIGAEAIGEKDPLLDTELIGLAEKLLVSFEVKDFYLEINSLGCEEDKNRFKSLLKKKLADDRVRSLLCENCQKRFFANPLRILDCKEANCRKVVNSLDIGNSYLCKSCLSYFEQVCSLLDKRGISYKVNPWLVRGLDYYTQIVFEFNSDNLGSQKAVGAGGRYDGLVRELGGPDKAGCGFALGLERILLLRKLEKFSSLKVFIAYTSSELKNKAFELLAKLRDEGISSDMGFKFSSLKSQLRYAQKLGVEFVVILGEEELKNNQVSLRDMKASSQERFSLDRLIDFLKEGKKC